jgi:hypothetical protein
LYYLIAAAADIIVVYQMTDLEEAGATVIN